jgi:hypothetical protein
MELVKHGGKILGAALGWQCLISWLRARKLPHAVFNLSHHVVVSGLSLTYLWRAYSHHWSVLSSSNLDTFPHSTPADEIRDVYAAPGDQPVNIGYVFSGYLIADILNRKNGLRPFTPLDWFHHSLAATYVGIGILFLPPNILDSCYIGVQECSSIFLSLLGLNYKHPVIKAAFISSFILARVCFGGWVAVQRTKLFMAGMFPSASIVYFWWVQLALNLVFTAMILRKLCKK